MLNKIVEILNPLSFIQKDLWTIQQLFPDNFAYNLLVSLHITSNVNLDALRTFFQILIDRHTILRTNYYYENNNFYQKINDHKIDFSIIDAADWPISKIKEQTQKFYQKPFNLKEDPLIKIVCFQKSKTSTFLVVVTHHIVSDGWSATILIKELGAMYPSIASGLPIVQNNLNLQYQDFVEWQHEFIKSEDATKQLNYWKNFLGDEIPILDVGQKNNIKAFALAGNTHFFKIDNTVIEKVKTTFNSITLNTFFLSMFHIVMHKYSSSDVVVSGSPRFSRLRTTFGLKRSDFRDNIGCLVNLVLNKTTINSETLLADFFIKTQEANNQIFKNQDYPFSLLVEKLQLKKSEQSIPQISFVYQKRSKNNDDISFFLFDIDETKFIEVGGLKLHPFYIPHDEGQHELTLELLEAEDAMYCNLKYQTNLFDLDYIKRLESHLRQTIDFVLANPDAKVAEIDILTTAEKQQILYDFNNTAAPYPKDKTIHQLFEEQVTKTPDNVAVVFEEQKLTYKELNAKANQIAHKLRDLGVKPDTIVAIMVERSLEMIIGIMGILKAGGAYLPIDPSLPAERINYMIEDSQTKILLIKSSKLKDLASNQPSLSKEGRTVFFLDDKTTFTDKIANLSMINKPRNLAYVIYTSGSTGKPKGVMIEHQNIHNLIINLSSLIYSQFCNPVNVTWLASYTFDASVQQIFASLLLGHQLHIISNKTKLNPQLLLKYYNQNDIKVSDGTPAYLNVLLSLPKNSSLKTVNYFLIGGEDLKTAIIEKFYSHFRGDFQIINVYGPTECCVDTISYKINKKSLPNLSSIPIGKSFLNTQIYILDYNNLPVPIGFEGEIHIAGDSVGRGYIDNELNKNIFINNFFNPNQKMYKTGDFGKWLEDGNILFLRRKDNQIKIRGFRIEIGEIENALLSLENITKAAVITLKNNKNELNLVAYFEASKDMPATKFKKLLLEKLPFYMIPTFFFPIKNMPLTTHGKIDRTKLINIKIPTEAKKIIQIKPKNKIEEKLIIIWTEILKTSEIDLSSSFQDHGGDSIDVIYLQCAIEQQFNITMPMELIFQNNSIIALAQKINRIKNKIKNKNVPNIITFKNKGSMPPIIFVHPVFGHGFCYNKLANVLSENQPFYAIDSPYKNKNNNFNITLKELVDEYTNTILKIAPDCNCVIGGWSFGGILAYEIANELINRGFKIDNLILIDSWAPILDFKSKIENITTSTILKWFIHDLSIKDSIPEKLLEDNKILSEKEEQTLIKIISNVMMKKKEVSNNNLIYQINNLVHLCKLHLNLLCNNYVAKNIYQGNLTIYKPLEIINEPIIKSIVSSLNDYLGWDSFVSEKKIEIINIPGNHYSIMREPYVNELGYALIKKIKGGAK